MLTRIEIHGFKTFDHFGLDLRPFQVILGPNGAGKSNLFDAIRLLSNLTQLDLKSATQDLRGEPHELFRWAEDGGITARMRFAVEVLLDPIIEDPWGQRQELKHTRLRYELEIQWHRNGGLDRLVVGREEVRPILASDDRWPSATREFQRAHLKYGRRKPYLTTGVTDKIPVFSIHQDGRAGRTKPAQAAGATILSSIRSSEEFPHLYALSQELASWRFVHLDPAALRGASSTVAPDLVLAPDGRNLPTVLNRMQAETATDVRPRGVLADVAAVLASMVAGVRGIEVHEDFRARELSVDFETDAGGPFPARVMSDGTLRLLGLLTVLYDPRRRGLLCYEEPENGIHPARLKRLIHLVQGVVTDPAAAEESTGEPVSQILMNSHSPVVLNALVHRAPEALLFADRASVTDGRGQVASCTRIRPVHLEDQGRLDRVAEGSVSSFEVERYLHAALSDG